MTDIFRALDQVPAGFGPCIAAIGNFDGVHRGHRQILSSVVGEARSRGMRAIAITFNPHPETVLRPGDAPLMLTPGPQREHLLAATGLDAILVLPFDQCLACLTARQFVQEILIDKLQVRGLHEGGNFRFGHKAEAGIEELKAFGAEFGFKLTVHQPVHVHGLEVSSSAVRDLIAAGDVRRARWMLGRPFEIRGTQKRDRGVGTRLLVPTINLAPQQGLFPGNGVYVTRLTIRERCFQAVTNVGNRPTFEDAGFSIESYILNFEPLEIGEVTSLGLEFLMRLRPEVKFAGTDDLRAQIMRDVAKAKQFFRLASRALA